jgi:wyosine [tRNA(Phe)-imidazoG37] synthetase (radical SAM superfamily)
VTTLAPLTLQDGGRLYRFREGELWCDWPFRNLVVNCDGRVSCGCTDPTVKRPMGDLNVQSVQQVWQGAAIEALRDGLLRGDASACGDCIMLKRELRAPATYLMRPLPPTMHVEPSVVCNLHCPFPACEELEEDPSRNDKQMSLELFQKVLDQAGPHLERLFFYNYGEPFVNPHAIEMIAHAKRVNPRLTVLTSTNGLLLLKGDRIERLVASGLDQLIVSVDGALPKSYERYRVGGKLDRALEVMRRVVQAKKAAGVEHPEVVWRYILFRWNDSDEEMELARRLAEEMDVDRLCWHTAYVPDGAPSMRFRPGNDEYRRIAHEFWEENPGANAIRSKLTSLHPHELQARLTPRSLPRVWVSGRRAAWTVDAQNHGDTRWLCGTDGRRGTVNVGVRLLDEADSVVDEAQGRSFLAADVPAGGRAEVRVEHPVRVRPGRYRLVHQMVCEQIRWFDAPSDPVPVEVLPEGAGAVRRLGARLRVLRRT